MVVNTTFCVEEPLTAEFIDWAKSVYLETACRDCGMSSPMVMRILAASEGNTVNYAVQCHASDNGQVIEWIDTFQPILLDSAAKKWGQRVLHFTTLMEEL